MDKLGSGSPDDIQLIRQTMQMQYLGVVSPAGTGHTESQKALELQKKAMNKKEAFEKGYDFCIREVESRSTDGLFVSGDNIPAISVETLKMNENAKQTIENIDFWKSYIQQPIKMHFLMNYSNDMLI
ncbi:MAG: hypothetical protein JSR46_09280, partial [Verrucomicrobia bacterium]|nr:hypothetical protein [Verrucomicrobiota bacterium]